MQTTSDETQESENDNSYISIVASAVIVAFQLIFFCSLMTSSHCRSSSTHTVKNVLQYISLGIFICLGIAYSIWIIEEYLYRYHHSNDIWFPFYWLFFVFLGISFILFYLLMVFRLFHTFKYSKFALKFRTIIFYIILIVLIICIGSITVIAKIMNLYLIDTISEIIVLALCCISSCHLVYLFNSKIFRLTLSIRQSVCILSESARNVSQNIQLNERQLALLVTVRKQTLLGCCIVIMFMQSIIIVIIYSFTSNQEFFWISWSISLIIATLCVYLGLNTNQSIYHCICNKCDHFCEILCNNITQTKLNQLRIQELSVIPNFNNYSQDGTKTDDRESTKPSSNLPPPPIVTTAPSNSLIDTD